MKKDSYCFAAVPGRCCLKCQKAIQKGFAGKARNGPLLQLQQP